MLDLILLLFLLAACLKGYRRGLIIQLFSLLRVALSILVAYQGTGPLVPAVRQAFPIHHPSANLLYPVITFFLLFFITRFLLSLVSRFLHRVFQFPILSTLNRAGGFLFALIQTLLIFAVLVHVLQAIPSPKAHEAVRTSVIAQSVSPLLQGLKSVFIGR